MLPRFIRALAAFLFLASAASAAAAPGGASAGDAWRLCGEAIATQERTYAIPKHLLSAIAVTETGRRHPTLGRRTPWPWSVMAEGRGRYLPTKVDAIKEVRALQANGVRNIDVGCMQINLMHHADAFMSLEQAFDPRANVAYAASFLRSLYSATGSWQEAAGLYHSATPEFKIPYKEKIVAAWNEQQRLELSSAALTSDFGSGAPGSLRQPVRSPAMLLSMADRRVNATTPQVPSAYRGLGARALDVDLPPQTINGRVPIRTLDQEAAFAARRAQYLQELRRAMTDIKREMALQVVRGDPRQPGEPDVR